MKASLTIKIEFTDDTATEIVCHGTETDMARLRARVDYWGGLEAEVTKLRADVSELESNLSASAESEKYLADRVDTLTQCILVEIAALEHNQRGSTHWEGCESRHHDCAAIKRMDAAIDAAIRARGEK